MVNCKGIYSEREERRRNLFLIRAWTLKQRDLTFKMQICVVMVFREVLKDTKKTRWRTPPQACNK